MSLPAAVIMPCRIAPVGGPQSRRQKGLRSGAVPVVSSLSSFASMFRRRVLKTNPASEVYGFTDRSSRHHTCLHYNAAMSTPPPASPSEPVTDSGPAPALTHIDERGQANMVDVASKDDTVRRAVACSTIRMQPATLKAIVEHRLNKGEVFATARIAGIQAAKRCSELIPLCHPLMLSRVAVEFEILEPDCLQIQAECRVTGKTGVEMEALTAASVAALTVYDMCKAIDRGMVIESTRLLHKSGGKSGIWETER